ARAQGAIAATPSSSSTTTTARSIPAPNERHQAQAHSCVRNGVVVSLRARISSQTGRNADSCASVVRTRVRNLTAGSPQVVSRHPQQALRMKKDVHVAGVRQGASALPAADAAAN